MSTYACRTKSGSLYVVRRNAANEFWLTGLRAPDSDRVAPLAGDVVYPVRLVGHWPPVVGYALIIYRRDAPGEPILPETCYHTTRVTQVDLVEEPVDDVTIRYD